LGVVRGASLRRGFLRRYQHAGRAKELAEAPLVQLRDAALGTGQLVAIKGVLIQASTGNAAHDPLRTLIINLLQVRGICAERIGSSQRPMCPCLFHRV
jgi:hypothetical protein